MAHLHVWMSMYTRTIDYDKGRTAQQWREDSHLIKYWELNYGHLYGKMNVDTYPTTYIKINSRWSIGSNRKAKPIKLLGHNKGNHLQNLGVGKVSQTGHQSNTLKWKVWQVLLFSRSVMSSSLRPYGLQHSWLPRPSLSPRVCSDSCPLSRWCHPTISPSVVPFSSCLQSFPASGTFPVSQLFASGGQKY